VFAILRVICAIKKNSSLSSKFSPQTALKHAAAWCRLEKHTAALCIAYAWVKSPGLHSVINGFIQEHSHLSTWI